MNIRAEIVFKPRASDVESGLFDVEAMSVEVSQGELIPVINGLLFIETGLDPTLCRYKMTSTLFTEVNCRKFSIRTMHGEDLLKDEPVPFGNHWAESYHTMTLVDRYEGQVNAIRSVMENLKARLSGSKYFRVKKWDEIKKKKQRRKK